MGIRCCFKMRAVQGAAGFRRKAVMPCLMHCLVKASEAKLRGVANDEFWLN